jgi:hypothetical protein
MSIIFVGGVRRGNNEAVGAAMDVYIEPELSWVNRRLKVFIDTIQASCFTPEELAQLLRDGRVKSQDKIHLSNNLRSMLLAPVEHLWTDILCSVSGYENDFKDGITFRIYLFPVQHSRFLEPRGVEDVNASNFFPLTLIHEKTVPYTEFVELCKKDRFERLKDIIEDLGQFLKSYFIKIAHEPRERFKSPRHLGDA